MQFQVPQFIETEDKIVGPLTLKQFFYLALPGFVLFLLFFVLQLWLWAMVASTVGALAIALAFGKVNGRPMSTFLWAAFEYLWQPKLYTFSPLPEPAAAAAIKSPFGGLRNLVQDLMTTTNAIPKREKPFTPGFGLEATKTIKERYEVIRKVTGEKEIARRVDYR